MGGVHSKYLLGGVESTINDTTKAALTAFVTLVIMKSGVGSTDPSIVSAFQCIDQQISNDVYTTSIPAYVICIVDGLLWLKVIFSIKCY